VPRPTPPPPSLPRLPEPAAERPRTIEPPALIGTSEGSSAFSLAELEQQDAKMLAARAKVAPKPMGGALFAEPDLEPEPAPAPAAPAAAPAPAPRAAPAPAAAIAAPKKPSIADDLELLDPDAPARPRPAAPAHDAAAIRAALAPPPLEDDVVFLDDLPQSGATDLSAHDEHGLDALPAPRGPAAPAAPLSPASAVYQPKSGVIMAPAVSVTAPAAPQKSGLEFDPFDEPPPVVPAVDLPAGPAPLLMDVTPHSLGIEMAGGHCSHLIKRNVPIPAEQVRVFTTARDAQDSVVVRICQGEGRRFAENQLLGEIELAGLNPAPRGVPKIQVSFILDASGTLESTAVDLDTGRAHSIRINLLGGYDTSELEALRKKHEAAWSVGGGP
jgi:molecular chaperone DnaK